MIERLKIFLLLLFFYPLSVASFAGNKQDVSLREKIGQMLIIGFKGMEISAQDQITKAIMQQEIGGVILFDYDFATKKYERNIKNPEQLKNLIHQLQHVAKLAAKRNKNNLYPLFISIDYEGGLVNRLKENYGFPPTKSAAVIGKLSLDDAEKEAAQMAATLKKVGVNFNFAPLVDVNINPQNPVIGKLQRSFSSDPAEVITYAKIFSQQYKAAHILCAYKHFPGHGSSTNDTHEGFVDITHTWQEEELLPYQYLLDSASACPVVMTGHLIHKEFDSKGYPASLSYAMTTALLRKQLHFYGMIVTDDLQMKAITEHYGLEEAVILAVNAGADLLVFGNQLVTTPQNPKEIIDIIMQAIKSKKIKLSQIETAYERIMQYKQNISATV